MAERQASGDPLKWRKFVSYAEFTPAHTPAEGHHIPGYAGHVPGVYSENLYAKTYGKITLQAVEGNFHKGVEQDAKEQVGAASPPTPGGHRMRRAAGPTESATGPTACGRGTAADVRACRRRSAPPQVGRSELSH